MHLDAVSTIADPNAQFTHYRPAIFSSILTISSSVLRKSAFKVYLKEANSSKLDILPIPVDWVPSLLDIYSTKSLTTMLDSILALSWKLEGKHM